MGASPKSVAAEPTARLGWRLAVLGVVWVLIAPLMAWVLLLFEGTGGFAGWRYTLALFLPLALLTWLVTRKVRSSRKWLLLAVGGWLLFGLGLPMIATPNDERVLAAAKALPAPPSATLLGHDLRGSYWCLGGCPQRWLYYAVPDADAAVKWMNTWAASHQWRQATLEVGGVGNGWCHGDFSLIVLEGSPTDQPQVKLHESVPGSQKMNIRVGANCR